ncbi:hypothetical protein LOZ39_006534 [Ophidiomyces ophidiicola]|nr:hypothetical protein LOZ49_006162 [Ophidiomyces ophidiicola]KAI2042122.1 hypothetical protein LOZ44_006366 [Ophidiomyces ophidiicola]KAI2066062.1 hypothetical protein LOZ39_006534 [Ophidiomyces ophidiicola]KAI2127828.1 hypothetical protein LOZ29_006571 [Ophidiomyces ophidiicola]KAI2129879.1 hypothetical protein LOZ28_006553 [Ophidiomyces ophidiicola]
MAVLCPSILPRSEDARTIASDEEASLRLALVVAGTVGGILIFFTLLTCYVYVRQGRVPMARRIPGSRSTSKSTALLTSASNLLGRAPLCRRLSSQDTSSKKKEDTGLTKPSPSQIAPAVSHTSGNTDSSFIQPHCRPLQIRKGSLGPMPYDFPRPPPLSCHTMESETQSTLSNQVDVSINAVQRQTCDPTDCCFDIIDPPCSSPLPPATCCGESGFPSIELFHQVSGSTLRESLDRRSLQSNPVIFFEEDLDRIGTPSPSPSLDPLQEFASEHSEPSSRPTKQVSRHAHTRSCSSTVIVLPGRSPRASISSLPPLHATASVISSWRKTRDPEAGIAAYQREDVSSLFQFIANLNVDDEVYDEESSIETYNNDHVPG